MCEMLARVVRHLFDDTSACWKFWTMRRTLFIYCGVSTDSMKTNGGMTANIDHSCAPGRHIA